MKPNFIAVLLSALLLLPASANPVISEFMADNETTIADEDGEFSDWVEIHNPTAEAIPLTNWYLTDSASNLTKWRFPAVTIAPGEFLLVWTSGKNRRVVGAPLHTSYSLSKDGEFLGLVKPDGTTIVHSYAPTFPAQSGDESYGLRFNSTKLLTENSTGRYRVPTSAADPGSTWKDISYDDSSWASGAGGFGYGITIPGITVRTVAKNGTIGGLTDALQLIALPESDPLVAGTAAAVFETVNILGDGSEGRYGDNELPPGNPTDHYVTVATGFITIPTTGIYTFGLNSDDGGQIVIDGMTVMQDDSFHGTQDALGRVTLTAGQHTFQALSFQGNGGAAMEFFAAPGSRFSFDASVFRLVGDVGNGGLAATTTPPGGGGLVGTDLRTPMTGSTGAYLRLPFSSSGTGAATSLSLVTRYNDGFTAWLNGGQVASENAPATLDWNSAAFTSRTNMETLRQKAFNLTASLPAFVNGENVMAIHGLNFSANDPNFLITSELIMGNLDTTVGPASYGEGLATPGWINGAPSSLGNVLATQFSVGRGFYTSPVTVALSNPTPGATIRYTLDGSTPSDTHGTIYTAPIMISSTTVLRACATLAGWTSSLVDTHTYFFPDDILVQSRDGNPAPGWPASTGTSQVLDYGMDPDIVNHSNPELGGPATVKAALLALPSISLTTDLPNLFDPSTGIYSNPERRGLAWERPVSMEWINPPDAANPNGTGEFQVNAGMRMRGGASRSPDNPKHAVRFIFRDEYGNSKLNYPVFGENAAQEFDKIDLRTSQNYSWSFAGDDRNTFLREESARQAQLDMGQPGSHVLYVHVYLNGQYWGLFNFDERPEASFAETYFGGKDDDYDVVKAEQESSYTIGATDGNLAAWQDLWNKGKAHRALPTNANYFKMMGLAADGVTPTADPVLLDPDNLIDYLLLTFWTGNLDGAVSSFLGNDRANNWYGSRRRDNNPRQGFRFFVHDFEHTFFNVNEDRTGPFTSGNEADFAYSNPLFLHQDLAANAEYQMRWADHIQKHLFNGGALTPGAWQNRINKLAAVVESSIVAESARWGDAKSSSPKTKQNWINAQNSLLSYLPLRNPVVLEQLRQDNLYPAIDAPVLSPFGGYQPAGVEIAIQGPAGATLYYMADGSDPRAVGGDVRPGAQVYTASSVTEDLIPWSASDWKYLGDGSNQGTAWRTDGFSDTTWPTGTAELGYGDGDEATLIPIVDIEPSTGGVQKPATYYFRRSFNLTDAGGITSLSLKMEYDDSYAVYLNGTRIAGNLPLNPAFNFYSGNTTEDIVETIAVSPSLLRAGENTISVEVHQTNNASSDVSMNLSLAAVRSTTATPLILETPGIHTLRIRAKSGAVWSALAESVYQVGLVAPTAARLVVSEISYHPASPHDDAEFLELHNVDASATLDLAGARFTDGIEFSFPAGSVLAPGGRVLLIKNMAAFQALYGTDKPVGGVFENESALSNTGERLRLESADGDTLLDFTYGIGFPWPESADGLGRSLILTNSADPTNPLSWRPSAALNGNPGDTDSFARLPGLDLLDYALASPAPAFDHASQELSATRHLGADDASLTPEWSTDLNEWFTHSFSLISENPQSGSDSLMKWKLDPLPVDKAFIRLRVLEKP